MVAFAAIAALTLSLSAPAQAAHGDITLLGTTTLTGSTGICDVWGYIDPNTGREYAIVGNSLVYAGLSRVWIVDVTDPTTPTEVTFVDADGFDVKGWDHYMYTCDGDFGGTDSRIIDMSNPLAPQVLDTQFRSAHNLAVAPEGYLFLEYPGFTVWDINADPENPSQRWQAGNLAGHDATPVPGQRVWDFGGSDPYAKLWDYSDPDTLELLSTVAWPAIHYWHSGDETDDRNHLFVCDELAQGNQADIYVFDVSNYALPSMVTTLNDPNATVHNLYIIGDLAFVSYYNSGFKTIDVSDPTLPVVADAYDTNLLSGDGYDGAFGVYPFSPNGIVLVSDWDNGLFVFEVEGFDGYNNAPTAATRPAVSGATLHQNFPNPFNPTTTISYELLRADRVTLGVYDVRGVLVKTLESARREAGSHQVTWNGTDTAGNAVSSGVYYYRLEVGSTTTTKKMVLLK
jgi:choice-of-anchor B domain-containing protein